MFQKSEILLIDKNFRKCKSNIFILKKIKKKSTYKFLCNFVP